MKMKYRLLPLLLDVVVAGAAAVVLVSCRPPSEERRGPDAVAPDVVATIGEYSITKDELKRRLAREIRPQREDDGLPARSVTAESVLREMLAEKAMSMEGRALGYLNDEAIRDQLEQVQQRKLVQALLTEYVREKIPIAQEEIDERLKANPQLTRDQAERQIQTPKVGPVLEQFYAELLEKYGVEKVKENFAEASRIHQRLLTQPAKPRGQNVYWIMNSQVQDDLSEAEKSIVLVKYEGGQFTLEQWFKALCQLAPPSRPKDLNTTAGVEKLVDRALQPFILVAEARVRGCDKDEQFLQEMRDIEDIRLLGKLQSEKLKDIAKPTDDEIKAYFEAHQERFGISEMLKIDQVWCKDLQAAGDAKKMLDDGAALETVKSTCSLSKNEQAHSVYPGTEGIFWAELWKAEPNEVIGPVRGFYTDGVKWRIVKVLEKRPAQPQPYSDAVRNRVESAITTQRRREILTAYRAELLQRYPYELYADKIKDIDPLEVTPAIEAGD